MADLFVVDASAAAKWFLHDEPDSAAATDLLLQFKAGRLDLVAPDCFPTEVASAVTAATHGRQPRLSRAQGRRAIADLLGIGIPLVSAADVVQPAYDLVHEHGCALYDALHLALAQHVALPLVAADCRLHQRVGGLSGVIWLASFFPSPPAV